MKPFRTPLLAAALLLSACSGSDVKGTFGLNRTAPDEFVVVSRPPLSVPPEFDLKPPRPGATGPNQPSTEEQAHKLLTGKDSPPSSLDDVAASASPTAVTPVLASEAPDGPTANFLSRIGVDKADENIRDKLNEDAMVPHGPAAKSFYEEMMGTKGAAEPVVDAPKEADRLRDNKDTGKPINEGEVPVQQDKPMSVLDEIF